MRKIKCVFCKDKKKASLFNKDASRSSGYSNKCRECMHSYQETWYSSDRKTIHGFLQRLYNNMKKRVEGRNSQNPHYWAGKPILPKETFFEWSRNHPDFLRLFKRWILTDCDIKLSPSINRINSKKGYTLDNIEWVTMSQNSSLAGATRSFNKRSAVYALLGEKNATK